MNFEWLKNKSGNDFYPVGHSDGIFYGANSESTVSEEIVKLNNVVEKTLTSGSWSSTAPYTQEVVVSGITATSRPIISVGTPATKNSENFKNAKKAFGMIDCVDSGSGKITFYCYSKKPTSDIPIIIKGF